MCELGVTLETLVRLAHRGLKVRMSRRCSPLEAGRCRLELLPHTTRSEAGSRAGQGQENCGGSHDVVDDLLKLD